MNDHLASEIIERTAGGETLSKILLDDHMPHRAAVWRWQLSHPDFRDELTHARAELGSILVDQAIAHLDDGLDAAREGNGSTELIQACSSASRLKLMIAERLNKQLSPRTETHHTGSVSTSIQLDADRAAAVEKWVDELRSEVLSDCVDKTKTTSKP